MKTLLFACLAFFCLSGCSGGSDDAAQPAASVSGRTEVASTAQPSATTGKGTPQIVTATSINLTKSVARGGNATARVGTAPNAKCTIAYTTPSGTRSEAAGLESKTADAKGEVSWTWVIGTATTPGEGTVGVVCDGQPVTAPITIT